jgi:hypothetical protein
LAIVSATLGLGSPVGLVVGLGVALLDLAVGDALDPLGDEPADVGPVLGLAEPAGACWSAEHPATAPRTSDADPARSARRESMRSIVHGAPVPFGQAALRTGSPSTRPTR